MPAVQKRILDRQESEHIVAEAMMNPELYTDRRDLLGKLILYSGRTNDELVNMQLSSLRQAISKEVEISYDLIATIVKTNVFNLPATIPITRKTAKGQETEQVSVKDFFYDYFGFVDIADEAKIQKRINDVFEANASEPAKYTIATLVQALMLACGRFGSTNDVRGVNKKELSRLLGYDVQTLFSPMSTSRFPYNALLKLADKIKNPLHLYYSDDSLYHERVDAIFAKNEMTHWRPEKRHRNAREVMLEIRRDKPPFYRAVQELLPKDYVDRREVGKWMRATLGEDRDFETPMSEGGGRANMLLGGCTSFPDAERDAAIEVIRQHTELGQDDLDFLKELNTRAKKSSNTAFSEKLLAMLKRYMNREHGGAFSLRASSKDFASLACSGPERQNPLAWVVIQGIARKTQNVTLQSVRAIVAGFDQLKEQSPWLVSDIDNDIDALLATTGFTRERLFQNANQAVEQFDENNLWPIDARKTRIGQLISDIRASEGLDIGLEELSRLSAPDETFVRVAVYSTSKNTDPIPVKDNPRSEVFGSERDNLDRIIEGIQAGLEKYGQPRLTKENIAKIRRVGVKSYDETLTNRALIIAENARRSRLER